MGDPNSNAISPEAPETSGAVVADAKPQAKPAKKSKKKPNKKKDLQAEMTPRQTGRIASLDCKVDGAGKSLVTFSLKAKKGKARTFAVPSADMQRLAAITSILAAAFSSGSKVQVEYVAVADAPGTVSRIEIHAKN